MGISFNDRSQSTHFWFSGSVFIAVKCGDHLSTTSIAASFTHLPRTTQAQGTPGGGVALLVLPLSCHRVQKCLLLEECWSERRNLDRWYNCVSGRQLQFPSGIIVLMVNYLCMYACLIYCCVSAIYILCAQLCSFMASPRAAGACPPTHPVNVSVAVASDLCTIVWRLSM